MELITELQNKLQGTTKAVPPGWEVVSISDCFEFKNGLNKGKEFFGHGTPIINYMDVYNNGGLTKKDVRGKVKVTGDEINNYKVKKGDVLFTRTSETVEEVGVSSVLLEDIDDAVFSGFLLRARPRNNKLDLQFKKYCFKHSSVRKQIISTSSYTTRALTNGRLLSAVCFKIPTSLEEQRKIATALSDADALISSLEKLIEKKRLVKEGAMQDLLKPKEGWEMKRLGNDIRFQVGFPFSSVYFNSMSNGVRLVKNRDLKSDDTIIFYHGNFSEDYIVENGDILVGMDGDFTPCLWTKGKSLLNQRVGRIKPNCKIDRDFLYYYIRKPLAEIESITSSTTVKHLSHTDVENIEIPIPEISSQIHIGQILSNMDAEIQILEQKLEKYKQIKQGMMQQLLTGRKRLV